MLTSLGLNPNQVVEMKAGFPDPATLENAVVFIRAIWSGPSKVSLLNLVDGIQAGLDPSWKLIILDTDTLDIDSFVKVYGPFPSSGGWGESFWIKDGSLVYSDRGYYNPALIKLLWDRIREFSSSELPVPLLPDLSDKDSFRQSAKKNCGEFPLQCLEIDDQKCLEIEDLRMAVVTLYHVNRASAVVTLRTLAEALIDAGLSDLRLIVLNADAVSFHDMARILEEAPVPARTYWIRYGQVVFKDDGFYLPKQRETLAQRIDAFRQIAD